MLATTGHTSTVGSVAVCILKYRVKTTGTDKRHVVSVSNVQISKVSIDFMFHDHDTAERPGVVRYPWRDTGTAVLEYLLVGDTKELFNLYFGL
jgi:hypothetical protein